MYCPECGEKNAEDSVFCVACGTKLIDDLVSGEKEVLKSRKKNKKKKDGSKKSSKKIIKIIVIILFVLALVVVGGVLGWQWYQSSRSTGSSWGDIYYEFIKESRKEEDNKANIPNGSTIEFIQVSDIDDPVMVVQYEEKEEDYSDLYYINKDKVENVISMPSSDVELLYHIENKDYQWYVHTTENEKEDYVPVVDAVFPDDAKDENHYTFDVDESIRVETVDGEEISLPKVDSIFIKPDIEINEIEYSTELSDGKLKDAMIEGVEEYQSIKDITTDDVKEEVKKEEEKIEVKLEEIKKATEEVEKKKEEEAIKLTSSNVTEKIGTHLKWFSSAYLGVIYGWYHIFPYNDVSDTVTIPTNECQGAMINEVTGLKSINNLKTQLSNYVLSSQISRFDFNDFTEYNNQVYWCNMGVGDGPYIDTSKAKVLSSADGISKVQLEVYNMISEFKMSTITLTVTYNKDTSKYLITDWTVVQINY